ncbi:transposase [Boseaceae bacterium BT-24-1]|nr:transposase [Boseaceae bacterium BT-24-1]
MPAASPARQRGANRGALPPHLPRIEMIVDIESDTCPCCSGKLHPIGEDVAEHLDRAGPIPCARLHRPKYACRSCEDVVSGPGPLIEGGIPTEATVAHLLVSKYADHLPLYRQAQIYARQRVVLDRSTLADWVGRAAFLLRPVHERMLAALKSSPQLFADETTAACARSRPGPDEGGPALGSCPRNRPGGGADPPGVVCVYAPHRKAERPIAQLAGFRGILQVEATAATRCWPNAARFAWPYLTLCRQSS